MERAATHDLVDPAGDGGACAVAPAVWAGLGAVPARRIWACYAVAVAIAVLFVSAICAAPWCATHDHTFFAAVLYSGFKAACHQMPERSFTLFGAPLAVCSRCTAIYAGGLLGLLLVPLVRGLRRPPPDRLWIILAAIPVVADFGLGWLGILANTFVSRSVTGVVLGAVSAFYILPGLLEAAVALLWRRPAILPGDAHGTK